MIQLSNYLVYDFLKKVKSFSRFVQFDFCNHMATVTSFTGKNTIYISTPFTGDCEDQSIIIPLERMAVYLRHLSSVLCVDPLENCLVFGIGKNRERANGVSMPASRSREATAEVVYAVVSVSDFYRANKYSTYGCNVLCASYDNHKVINCHIANSSVTLTSCNDKFLMRSVIATKSSDDCNISFDVGIDEISIFVGMAYHNDPDGSVSFMGCGDSLRMEYKPKQQGKCYAVGVLAGAPSVYPEVEVNGRSSRFDSNIECIFSKVVRTSKKRIVCNM